MSDGPDPSGKEDRSPADVGGSAAADLPVSITTWYFAAAASGGLPRIPVKAAEKLLATGVSTPSEIDESWRDLHGHLTLVCIVLILQRGRPIYVERCHVARLSGQISDTEDLSFGLPTWEDVAAHLRRTAGVEPQGATLRLAAFLASAPWRALPADIVTFMHDTMIIVQRLWVGALREGRYQNAIFDLRTMSLQDAGTPLRL